MEPTVHAFSDLFAQLGLPNDAPSIRGFIATHAPLADNIRLEDAPFWSASQAQLLRDERIEDADWAIVVDQLNLALRAPA
ncbi:DUF2789 domain-containing protein [Pseudoxanthomonas daejeonensis]|uniref:DUF2789 domain-containing protein n=1 Tax=Pseudoxanthomonas daejeonensis TaxID=266062 RepID=A0ABQ6Z698_9GAMM|nr:DUF2789 domain-containing protein [Pseudoxanthomonas daejeonensis]KAF1694008.1 hypothetical protein CSC65_10120 [Pseudoxanthomonas daejeonensis]UNK57332.1 DUF2789 domain-containing protein [Pseudoxanthomonas daejeonensis]